MGSIQSGEERDSEILWEVQKLTEKFEEISERYEKQQSSLDNFSKSIDNLNESVKRLVAVFERAEKIIASDKGDKKLDTVLKQSSDLVKSVSLLAGEVQSMKTNTPVNASRPVQSYKPPVSSQPSVNMSPPISNPLPSPSSIPEVPRHELEPENPVPKPYNPNEGIKGFDNIPPPPKKTKGFFK